MQLNVDANMRLGSQTTRRLVSSDTIENNNSVTKYFTHGSLARSKNNLSCLQ